MSQIKIEHVLNNDDNNCENAPTSSQKYHSTNKVCLFRVIDGLHDFMAGTRSGLSPKEVQSWLIGGLFGNNYSQITLSKTCQNIASNTTNMGSTPNTLHQYIDTETFTGKLKHHENIEINVTNSNIPGFKFCIRKPYIGYYNFATSNRPNWNSEMNQLKSDVKDYGFHSLFKLNFGKKEEMKNIFMKDENSFYLKELIDIFKLSEKIYTVDATHISADSLLRPLFGNKNSLCLISDHLDPSTVTNHMHDKSPFSQNPENSDSEHSYTFYYCTIQSQIIYLTLSWRAGSKTIKFYFRNDDKFAFFDVDFPKQSTNVAASVKDISAYISTIYGNDKCLPMIKMISNYIIEKSKKMLRIGNPPTIGNTDKRIKYLAPLFQNIIFAIKTILTHKKLTISNEDKCVALMSFKTIGDQMRLHDSIALDGKCVSLDSFLESFNQATEECDFISDDISNGKFGINFYLKGGSPEQLAKQQEEVEKKKKELEKQQENRLLEKYSQEYDNAKIFKNSTIPFDEVDTKITEIYIELKNKIETDNVSGMQKNGRNLSDNYLNHNSTKITQFYLIHVVQILFILKMMNAESNYYYSVYVDESKPTTIDGYIQLLYPTNLPTDWISKSKHYLEIYLEIFTNDQIQFTLDNLLHPVFLYSLYRLTFNIDNTTAKNPFISALKVSMFGKPKYQYYRDFSSNYSSDGRTWKKFIFPRTGRSIDFFTYVYTLMHDKIHGFIEKFINIQACEKLLIINSLIYSQGESNKTHGFIDAYFINAPTTGGNPNVDEIDEIYGILLIIEKYVTSSTITEIDLEQLIYHMNNIELFEIDDKDNNIEALNNQLKNYMETNSHSLIDYIPQTLKMYDISVDLPQSSSGRSTSSRRQTVKNGRKKSNKNRKKSYKNAKRRDQTVKRILTGKQTGKQTRKQREQREQIKQYLLKQYLLKTYPLSRSQKNTQQQTNNYPLL